MASSINTVAISGNLTRDAEVRETANGSAVVSFTVAVNDRRKDPQTGEWADFPNYIDCTMFGNYARAVAHSMKKGVKVAVMGKLRWSQWQAQDGTKRSKVEVIADSLEVFSRKEQPQETQYGQQTFDQGAQPSNWGSAYRAIRNGEAVPEPVTSVYDDDCPF